MLALADQVLVNVRNFLASLSTAACQFLTVARRCTTISIPTAAPLRLLLVPSWKRRRLRVTRRSATRALVPPMPRLVSFTTMIRPTWREATQRRVEPIRNVDSPRMLD